MPKRNKTHPLFLFCKMKKVQTSKETRRAHMPCFFFLSDPKSQSSHTNIHFICKIVQGANFFFFLSKKKETTLTVFLQWGSLSFKKTKNKNSTMTHSLHSFKSPDVILSATRRQKTQTKKEGRKKSSCTNDNTNKKKQSKGLVGAVFTPHNWNTELCRKTLRWNSKREG